MMRFLRWVFGRPAGPPTEWVTIRFPPVRNPSPDSTYIILGSIHTRQAEIWEFSSRAEAEAWLAERYPPGWYEA